MAAHQQQRTQVQTQLHPGGNPEQIDGLFSQLPYKYHQHRVVFAGNGLDICPCVTLRVDFGYLNLNCTSPDSSETHYTSTN